MSDTYQCRPGCGACCIVLSISSPIPGMPNGKPAFVRCVQLSEDNRCMIHTSPLRPECCRNLKALPEMCGGTFEDAWAYLSMLEEETRGGHHSLMQ